MVISGITEKLIQETRKRKAREADESKIKIQMFGGGFDRERRYDLKYMLSFARDANWSASRLNKALQTVDLKERYRPVKNKS